MLGHILNSSVRLIVIGCLVVFCFLNASNSSIPNFRWPVDIPVQLSGTFGELRSNHFHAGLDIKSPTGSTGTPIYAAEDGFISRIKIQAGGYGQALYLQHEGGYSTVYAHLDRFEHPVEEYVRREQYKKEQFALNLYPTADQFPVKKGQRIGLMGNSGYSFGPHLHFEIRRHQVPVNPLKYLELKDQVKPKIREVYIHDLDLHADSKNYKSLSYAKLEGDTMFVAGDQVGISMWTYDPHNEALNKNGIYRISLKVDGKPHFTQAFNSIPFSFSRYANACMNYSLKKKKNKLAYLFFYQPGNLYKNDVFSVEEGRIRVTDNPVKIECIVEDFSGNTSSSSFWISRNGDSQKPRSGFNYKIPHDQDYELNWNNWTMNFPKNAVYQDLYLKVSREKDSYIIGDETTPLHKYVRVRIAPNNKNLTDKHHLIYCDEDGKEFNVGGQFENSKLAAQIRDFGEYYIGVDTIAPTLKNLVWNQKGDQIYAKWKIEDNIPTRGKAKSVKVKASLNGQWTLVKRDAKSNTLTWEEKVNKGKHFLEILVTDDRKNQTIWKKNFNIQ